MTKNIFGKYWGIRVGVSLVLSINDRIK